MDESGGVRGYEDGTVKAGAEAARRAYRDAVGRDVPSWWLWLRIAEAVLSAAEGTAGPASREFRAASKAVKYGGRSFQTPQEQGLMLAQALLALTVEVNGLRAEGLS